MESYNEIIQILGGTTVVLAALFGFIGKVWLAKIIENHKASLQQQLLELQAKVDATNKKLNAELQSATYISQIQLEHEYKIYQEIWALLVELKTATLTLRPIMDYVDPNQSQQDRIRERLQAFSEKFNAVFKALEHNRPFYPNEIYEVLDHVCEKCRHESIDSEYIERNNAEYYKEARKNQQEIVTLINSACDKIRARLGEVRVK
ncbi:hypothetical protein ACEO96_18790 [Vibrio anguillarum]|uniref:hypothetical protein n=1 Tax=Vibrio TaxID=662 RepID=UPI000E6D0B7B|nr:hypothetical protein [Vibrio cholerae]TQP19788.1 hypothetical protein FLM04_15180 [Vibrio cholerae]TQP71650.1 hypothetical protein FLL75_16265 [Vibrio cholerae]TQP87237.1 hypothetical protein FLL87_18175 [Vibrio cholerae]TQQ63197.1 hypothetical protein FLL83_10865 [Vibrio cholerae]GIA35922.1 hypothetical protein VCSRO85_3471 [Vibrio cholerae]